MCLGPEWFSNSRERIEAWNQNGVSQDEARHALFMLGSTAYPIATEMAAWLYEHWTLRQIDELGPGCRMAFLRAIGDPDTRAPMETSYFQAVKLIALDRLPTPCIIRHEWNATDLPGWTFLAIFCGTAEKHTVLFGEKCFSSVAEWITSERARACNSDRPAKYHIAGHCPTPWWSQIEFLYEGRWIRPVERVPGVSAKH